MTKKHFIAIAEIIRENGNIVGVNELQDLAAKATAKQIAKDLARFFAGQNTNFDRTRFLDACGVFDESVS